MISQTDLFHPLLLIGQGGKSARVFSTHLNKIWMAVEADSKAKSPKCPSTTRSRCVLTCFGQRCTCLLVWPKEKRTFAPSWLVGGKACPKPLWWARPCAQGAYGGYAPRAEPHIFLLCKWLLGLCQHLFWWLSAFAQASWWSPKWWFLCSRYWPAGLVEPVHVASLCCDETLVLWTHFPEYPLQTSHVYHRFWNATKKPHVFPTFGRFRCLRCTP